jgi:hypothetical protein
VIIVAPVGKRQYLSVGGPRQAQPTHRAAAGRARTGVDLEDLLRRFTVSVPAVGPSDLSERQVTALAARSYVSRSKATGFRAQ